MRARQAFIEEIGGPEVIQWRDAEIGEPGAGELLVRHEAVGLNFIDTYHRGGIYPVRLPSGLGMEAAGIVEAAGEGVSGLAAGDRVAMLTSTLGAYADRRIVSADAAIRLPENVSAEQAAASLLKGQTAEALIERCAKVKPGWTVLVHAAAGATGQILVQWLKAIGATTIGTVSSDEKEAIARKAGVDHVIRYDSEDVAAGVRDITGGQGAEVVLDGVGMATWEASLASCKRRGLVVSFGNASGPVTGIGLGPLATHGSLYVTRPTMFDYYVDPAEAAVGTKRLFGMLESGAVTVEIGQRYALEEAEQAHRDLEGRKTIGASILVP
ncbi:quinone oxidoreductase family protein [Parasphingopyxis marina]|uniref:Quinone oxidoreductase n=1 Tax=Parasphingopyxis marina TaxID=2761622 RepID=A0A842HWN7_9SPHN|nr:quinone oxidoreductase [Parasphingopyxis marina]MBC2777382.1 quinone oxidoreductase [Parasphingopyxis marina]